MARTTLMPQVLTPVRPILIVGANVEGKANFMEVGGGGSVSSDPPMIALPIRHERYTLKGIMQNRTFSVIISSVKQMKEADYCGIISGASSDKTRDCRFSVFYGKLGNAPMIEQSPVNMECTVMHLLSTKSHIIVIGRVDGTYIAEEYLRDGKPDIGGINPLLWSINSGEYFAAGGVVGRAGREGREIKPV